MTEESKSYQLTYLLSPVLDQKKIEEISQKIKKWVTEKGGSFSEKEKSLVAFPKRLAYPIQKYQEAFYLNLNFLLAKQTINQLGQQLKLEKNILRYFIVTKQKLKAKPIQEAIDYRMANKIERLVDKEVPLSEEFTKERSFPDRKDRPAISDRKKVQIEELDKKLEEILNE